MTNHTPVDPPCARCGELKSLHFWAYRVAGGDELLCRYTGSNKDPHSTDVARWHDTRAAFRRRVADMPREGVAPHPDVELGRYRHVKSGNLYDVVGGVFDATGDDDRVMVGYVAVADGYRAARTPEQFLEKFTHAPEEDV